MLNQPPYQPISQWLSGLPSMPRLLHQKKMINQQQLQQKVATIYTEIAQHSAQECVLLCHDSYYFIIALLATLHTGKTPVLLGHNNLDKLLGEHDNQQLILTDGKIEKSDKLWSIPHMLETTSVQTSFTLPAIDPQTALILYTSGSSGNAKKVVKTVESMDTEARWLAQRWQTQFNTSLVKGSVSHNHLYGLTFRIWLPLSIGYLIDTQMVEFPEQLMDDSPFIFITSPVFLHYMDTALSPPTWTFMVSAGGILATQLAQKIFDWSGTAIHEIYGSTETGIIAYREQPSQDSGWQPFSELSLIPCGEQRYQLCSPLLCEHQPFLLDDKLSFTENGRFVLLGRVDRIIKIGEKRVSITEIENKLRQFELIDDVEIVAVQRNNRTYLGAVVVTSIPTEKLSQQQISAWRQELKKCIDPIAIPRFWRQVTTIPLNNQSKRSWSQLQELFNVSH